MASIQSLGLGSNVLTSELVDQIIEAERAGTEALITQRQTVTEAKISAYGEIESLVSAFQLTVNDLTKRDIISGTTSSSSDESIVTVSSDNSATTGTYNLEVQAIAEAHSLSSAEYADPTSIVSTAGGVLDFRFGTTTYTGAGNDVYDTFTVNSDKSGASVTIAANSTLADIRDTINAADFGVTASIVFNGSGYVLSMVSDDSGLDNSIEVTASASAGGPLSSDGLEALAFNASQSGASNLSENQQAQDAQLTFNGLNVTRESNSISDLITGADLTLQSANVGQNISISIETDITAFSDKVGELVDNYNALKESVDFYTDYDTAKNEAGLLTGDGTIRRLMDSIDNIMASSVSGITGKEYESFAEIGITKDQNNDFKMVFDPFQFTKAIGKDRDTIGNIFGTSGSTTDSLITYSNESINTQSGTYDISVTQLGTKATYEGAIISTLDFSSAVKITSGNDDFSINVDGKTANITLTQGDYTTGADLAAEIQSQINNASSLKNNGAGVAVSYDATNLKFDITSNLYGSDSQVYFTSVDTNTANTLGFNTLSAGGFNGSDISSLSTAYLLGAGASTVPGIKVVAETTGIDFSANNATFSLDVDGGGAVAVTVNQDASGADLNGDSVFGDRLDTLQAIQNAIDATALNGVVTASFDSNNKLVFTTNAVGAAKSIEITAVGGSATDTLLGLSATDGVQTNGRDAGLTLTANQAEFDLTLDGVTTSSLISIPAGTYTTGNDIATAVETAINTALGADPNFTPLVVGATIGAGSRDISTAIDFSTANSGFVLNVNGTEQEVIISADATITDNLTEINNAIDAVFGAGVVTASLDGSGLRLTTDATGHTQSIQMVSDGRGAQTTAGAVIAAGIDFSGANNATFDMTVDGVLMSVDVNTDASAGDGEDSLAAIQTAIDSALTASGQFNAGDVVAKRDSGNQLVLETVAKAGIKTGATFGSSASIQISNLNANATGTLGMVAETQTNGYDAFGISDEVDYGYDTTADVTYENDTDNGTGRLVITVGGNATELSFSNVTSDAISMLGIHEPDGTESTIPTGTDVSGTINGVDANGSGQFLTAQNGNTAAVNGYYVANQSDILSGPVVVDGTNDSFTLNLNGTEATVSVANGTYATGAALATAIETAINTTSAFSSLSYGVKAEYTDDAASALYGKISLISNTKGSSSRVEIESISAAAATAYGFEKGQADGEKGADAVGSVDDASGIRVKVLGGSTGDRGSITYISGLADQLNDVLKSYLQVNTGDIDLRVDGLNDELDEFTEELEELDARMAAQEELIRAKFLAADKIIAGLKSLESYVTQQFEAFTAASKS